MNGTCPHPINYQIGSSLGPRVKNTLLFTPLSGVYVSNRAFALIKLPFNQASSIVNHCAYAPK